MFMPLAQVTISVERDRYAPADHRFGRSEGGWTTKSHLVIDQDRGVLAFHLTAGHADDGPELITMLETHHSPSPVDKTYSPRANQA